MLTVHEVIIPNINLAAWGFKTKVVRAPKCGSLVKIEKDAFGNEEKVRFEDTGLWEDKYIYQKLQPTLVEIGVIPEDAEYIEQKRHFKRDVTVFVFHYQGEKPFFQDMLKEKRINKINRFLAPKQKEKAA
jgi:hypothetical protein